MQAQDSRGSHCGSEALACGARGNAMFVWDFITQGLEQKGITHGTQFYKEKLKIQCEL